MWFTIMSSDEHFLRRIVLRAYWDGERTPSVEVPVGDFFGTGFAYKHYLTPVPRDVQRRILLLFPHAIRAVGPDRDRERDGSGDAFLLLSYQLPEARAATGADMGYFHASWRREPRTNPHSPMSFWTQKDAVIWSG